MAKIATLNRCLIDTAGTRLRGIFFGLASGDRFGAFCKTIRRSGYRFRRRAFIDRAGSTRHGAQSRRPQAVDAGHRQTRRCAAADAVCGTSICRTPPTDGDVLRLGGLDGVVRAARSRGVARAHPALPEKLRGSHRRATKDTSRRYVGDGILTYFGWPKAHEDDAERAVRAALEVTQAVKGIEAASPLSVHIGIATGPGGGGARPQRERGGEAGGGSHAQSRRPAGRACRSRSDRHCPPPPANSSATSLNSPISANMNSKALSSRCALARARGDCPERGPL